MVYTPFAVILAILAVVVIGLLAYRRKLTAWEDDSIHIHEGEEHHVDEQQVLALKLGKVDRIGKILTTVVVVGALALGVIYVYLQFADNSIKMG